MKKKTADTNTEHEYWLSAEDISRDRNNTGEKKLVRTLAATEITYERMIQGSKARWLVKFIDNIKEENRLLRQKGKYKIGMNREGLKNLPLLVQHSEGRNFKEINKKVHS